MKAIKIKIGKTEVPLRNFIFFCIGLLFGMFFICSLLFPNEWSLGEWFRKSKIDNWIRWSSFIIIPLYPLFLAGFWSLIDWITKHMKSLKLERLIEIPSDWDSFSDILCYLAGLVIGIIIMLILSFIFWVGVVAFFLLKWIVGLFL